MFNRLGHVAGLALVIAFLSSSAFAQGGSAVINGTIYDQAKAVLPGVTITVTNEATGITREAVTGDEGQFVVPTLMPGTYTVRAELSGFQTQTRTGLVLLIGQELSVDLTLGVAGLAETVTVTTETPIVETTTSRIGANVTAREIDSLPSQGRNHLSLMQLVPGLVPDLAPGEFEGGNFNVNGRTTASNVWSVDGAANQDTDGGGTGPQARITLDSMAEFQVLTHQYTAEFGGSSGVVVNAVTKSGTNNFFGRGFYYFEDESLRALDPFLKEEGVTENPESGRDTFGFNVGGPIVRNKAFFFFNLERNLIENAVVHNFPASAAPIATNYADASIIKALSTFGRVDFTQGAHGLSFRYQREVAPAVGEDFECCQTLDNRQIELDSNDRMINAQYTLLLGNRATNEVRFSHVGEDRVDGNLAYMGIDPANYNTSGWIDDLEFVGLNGRDQFDIGSLNEYEDFQTGLAAAHGGADSRNYTLQDTFTFVTGGGAHTLKAGFTYNKVMVRPQRIGANDNGTFEFQHNTPFSSGERVHLSGPFLGRARGHRDRRGGYLEERVPPGPVAGEQQPDAEPGPPLRLPESDAEHEGRLRAASWLRIRRWRRGPHGHPRRRGQVLRVPPHPHRREPRPARRPRRGLHVRHGRGCARSRAAGFPHIPASSRRSTGRWRPSARPAARN